MTRASKEYFFSTSDGLSLFYREYPGAAAVPVLCLPGLTRNSRDFAALAERLDSHFPVLTPDLRGRGRSAYDPTWQNYHSGTYLSDVLQLLEHAAIRRVSIIGTSLGGILAMLLGASGKIVVESIVLNDVGPEVDPRGLARISQYVGKSAPVSDWKETTAQVRSTYGAALPGMSGDEWDAYARRSYREDGRGVPVLDMDSNIAEAVRAASAGAPAPDLWRLWPLLKSIPILAIREEHSDVLSQHTLERMKREKPDLQQLVVPNRGHAPTLDEPQCQAAIRAFLAGLPQ